MPSACAPTVGRLTSKVAIAACPSAFVPSRARATRASSFSFPPSRQCPGMRTSSRKTPAVCEARSPRRHRAVVTRYKLAVRYEATVLVAAINERL
jgi:hypothetical protein